MSPKLPSLRVVRSAALAVVIAVVIGVAVGVAIWLPLRDTGDAAAPAGAGRTTSPAAAGPQTSASPGATPTGAQQGTEVLPAPSSAPSASTGLPGLTPPPSTAKPLVTGTMPQQASAKGRLVTGYPAVLAPPAGQRVTTSSVSPGGRVLQVGLTASCRRPCDPLRPFRLRLAARGFEETAQQGTENRASAAFTRGSDSVTVSVTGSTRTSVTYALLGVLHKA